MTEVTPQQERFAQLVAEGKTYFAAYQEAYPKSLEWKDNPVYVESSKMMANPKISIRVKELQDENRKRNQVTLDEVLEEMAAWLRFDPADIMDEADCVKSIKQLPKEVRKSISEIRVQELYINLESVKTKIGEVKNIKFIDKRATADMFMKKFGQYVDTKKLVIEDLSYLDELLNGISK